MCRGLEKSLTIVIQIDNVDVLWQTKKTLQLNQSNYFHKLQMIDENLRGTLHASEYFRIQPLKQHTQPHPARLKTCRKKNLASRSHVDSGAPSPESTMAPKYHGMDDIKRPRATMTWPVDESYSGSTLLHSSLCYVFFRQASCTAMQFGPSRASWSSLYLGRSRIVTEVQWMKPGSSGSRICCPDAHSATMRRWNRSTGRKSTSKNSGIPRSCFFPK